VSPITDTAAIDCVASSAITESQSQQERQRKQNKSSKNERQVICGGHSTQRIYMRVSLRLLIVPWMCRFFIHKIKMILLQKVAKDSFKFVSRHNKCVYFSFNVSIRLVARYPVSSQCV